MIITAAPAHIHIAYIRYVYCPIARQPRSSSVPAAIYIVFIALRAVFIHFYHCYIPYIFIYIHVYKPCIIIIIFSSSSSCARKPISTPRHDGYVPHQYTTRRFLTKYKRILYSPEYYLSCRSPLPPHRTCVTRTPSVLIRFIKTDNHLLTFYIVNNILLIIIIHCLVNGCPDTGVYLS